KTPAAARPELCCQGTVSVDGVPADIHDADAGAVAGLDDAFLIAIVDAGVDVDAAEAPTGTPVVVEAVGRRSGGRESGSAERAGGDQTKCKLTKHSHSPEWREAIVVSLLLGRTEARLRSRGKMGIVFQK